MSYHSGPYRSTLSFGSRRKRKKDESSKDLQIIENILSNAERYIKLHISGISFMEEDDIQSYLVQLQSLCNLNSKHTNRKINIKYMLNRILQEYLQVSMEISQEAINSSFDMNLLTNANFLSNSSSDSGITPDVIPETQKSKPCKYDTRGMERKISFNKYSRNSTLDKRRKLSQSSSMTNSDNIVPTISNHVKTYSSQLPNHNLIDENLQIQKSVLTSVSESNYRNEFEEIINLVEAEESSSDAETIVFDLDNMDTNKFVPLDYMNSSKAISPIYCADSSEFTDEIIKSKVPLNSSQVAFINKTSNNPLTDNLNCMKNISTNNNTWIALKHQNTNFGIHYNSLINVSSSLCTEGSTIIPPTSYETNTADSSEVLNNTIAATYYPTDNTAISQTEINSSVFEQSQTLNLDAILFNTEIPNNVHITIGQSENARKPEDIEVSNCKTTFVPVTEKYPRLPITKIQDCSYIESQAYYLTNDKISSQGFCKTNGQSILTNVVKDPTKAPESFSEQSANVNTETILYSELPKQSQNRTHDSTTNNKNLEKFRTLELNLSKNVLKNSKVSNSILPAQCSSTDSLPLQDFSNKISTTYNSTSDNIISQTKPYTIFSQETQCVNSFLQSAPDNYVDPSRYSNIQPKKPRYLDTYKATLNKTSHYAAKSLKQNKENFVHCLDYFIVPNDGQIITESHRVLTTAEDNLPEDLYFSQSQHSQDLPNYTSSKIAKNQIQTNSVFGNSQRQVNELEIARLETNINASLIENTHLNIDNEQVDPTKKLLEKLVEAKNICQSFRLNFIEDLKKSVKTQSKVQTYIKHGIKTYTPFLPKANVQEVMDVEKVNDREKKTMDDIESMTELFADMLQKELKLVALNNNKLDRKN